MRNLFFAVACLAATTLAYAQQRDNRNATAWHIPAESQAAGFTAGVAHEGARPIALLIPPPGDGAVEGNFQITHSAAEYRGAILRLRASLRIESPRPGARARLWMRVERPAQAIGPLDDLSASPVKSDQWTRSEITLSVPSDARSVTFGVLSQGGARVAFRDVAIIPLRALAPAAARPSSPRNLSFQEGEEGLLPPGWAMAPEFDAERSGFRAWTSRKDCATISCAVLLSPTQEPADQLTGALAQSFDAAPYRGKLIEFRLQAKLRAALPLSSARIFLRVDPDNDTLLPANFLAGSESREVPGDAAWTEITLVCKVEPDMARIWIGAQLNGAGGTLWLDDVSFRETAELIPDAIPLVDLSPTRHEIRQTELETSAPQTLTQDKDKPPDRAQQSETINAAARLALRYVRNLPDFLCTEMITRAQKQGNKGWRNTDVLAIRVGFETGGEHYRLLTVNGKPSKASIRSLGGAQTRGEWGSLMEELFRPHTASFGFERFDTVRGRSVSVYRFEVPLDKSAFRLGVGTRRGEAETLSAYNGFVFIDRETHEVLRIEQIADPPPSFPIISARNVLDYDHSEVGGVRYLLPVRAETFVQSTTVTSHNVTEFRDYQKFSAEARIQFE